MIQWPGPKPSLDVPLRDDFAQLDVVLLAGVLLDGAYRVVEVH